VPVLTDDPDLSDEVLKFASVREKKMCLSSKGQPHVFTLHESQIEQGTLEDGSIRDQKMRYVEHVSTRQKQAPHAKTQDPFEVSLVREESKPWTHSRDEFMKYVRENPEGTDFKVRVWAHQHLFESRKGVANFFTGTKLELGFRNHLVMIWVDLTYEEESERSSVHNKIAHDTNTEDVQDNLHKLRYGWIRLGKFDTERVNSADTKRMKSECFQGIGITSKASQNTHHTWWKMATSRDSFFDKLITVCDNHDAGNVKEQKMNARGVAAAKLAQKTGQAGMLPPVDFNQSFKDRLKGTPCPAIFLNDMAWIKRDEDYDVVEKYMVQVINANWSIAEFLDTLSKYKSMKYVRIQLRTQVRF